MRLAFVGDVHITDPASAPSVRTSTYTEDILHKIRFISTKASLMECEVIVYGGDIFHLKSPSRNSHALVQSVHSAMTAGRLPVRIVAGNHDLHNDRLESLDKQPLGALFRMDGIRELRGPDPDFPLFGLPFLNDWDKELPEWMQKYAEWVNELSAAAEDGEMKSSTFMATHAPIFPDGENPPYEHYTGSQWAGMMVAASTEHTHHCAYAHIHDPHGSHTYGSVTLHNYGAISRGSLHAETLKRKPVFFVWDDGEVTVVDIPHRPAEQVFRLDVAQTKTDSKRSLTDFLDTIGPESVAVTSIEKVKHEIERDETVDETVRELAVELIESATA